MSQEDKGDRDLIGGESNDSHAIYLNAYLVFNEAHRHYELRNKNMVIVPPKKVTQGQASTSQPTKI